MVILNKVYITKGLFQNQGNRVAHYIIRKDGVKSNHHANSFGMELMETPTKRSC